MSQSRDNMQGGSSRADSTGNSGANGPEAAGGMDSLSGVSQRLRETAGQAREIAGHAREVISEKLNAAGDQLSQVGGQLHEGVDRIRHMERGDYEELWTGAKEKARENPGQTILIAAGVGFVLGMMMRMGGGRR